MAGTLQWTTALPARQWAPWWSPCQCLHPPRTTATESRAACGRGRPAGPRHRRHRCWQGATAGLTLKEHGGPPRTKPREASEGPEASQRDQVCGQSGRASGASGESGREHSRWTPARDPGEPREKPCGQRPALEAGHTDTLTHAPHRTSPRGHVTAQTGQKHRLHRTATTTTGLSPLTHPPCCLPPSGPDAP